MKKFVLPIFLVLLCIAGVASTFLFVDRKAPSINVNGTPTLGCSVSFNDLMKYASAEDEKGVKSFFIEEKSLSDIADYNHLTYVAIDENNNVSKQRVSVNVDPAVKTYHIEILKQPLQAQLRESLKASEYLALKNECEWTIDDTFVVEGVDFTAPEEYDARINVTKHDVEPVFATVEVADFNAPRIYLTDETFKDWANMIYTDEYFKGFIDRIEDDKDDPEELMEKININWREAMMPRSNGLVERGGTYTITYRVTDSDGNTGRETLKLLIEVPVYAPAEPAEGE